MVSQMAHHTVGRSAHLPWLVRRIEHTSGSDANGLCELVEDGGRGLVSRTTNFQLNSIDDVSHVLVS